MVPADRILDTAVEQGASVVGLSGLITPSLDEMVNVAREMERRGLDLPLLIGGATTIAPAHRRPDRARLRPPDDPRARRLARRRRRLGPARPEAPRRARRENREDQERLREQHEERSRKPLLPLAEARANRERVSFDELPVPAVHGRAGHRARPRRRCRDYIDWQFFFHAWELKGKFPAILERPEARELYDDATRLLDEIVRDGRLQARGVYGFWPARAEGDDVVLDEGTRFRFLRQQSAYGDSRPNRCLADYVAPEGDHLGAFAVGIHGADELAARFEAEHDDYHAIMVQGARRPARRGVRRVAARAGSPRLVRDRRSAHERRSDRRALPRHPAGVRLPGLPGPHREAQALRAARRRARRALAHRELRHDAGRGQRHGVYLAHPEARYFSVGRIGRDQVEDYAARKGWDARRGRALARPEPGVHARRADPA